MHLYTGVGRDWHGDLAGYPPAAEKVNGDSLRPDRTQHGRSAMGYRFYENWTAEQKAVVHREDCGHCSFGKGCHDNPLGDKNGR